MQVSAVHKIVRAIVLAPMLVLAAACATPYAEPSGGPTSTIEFINEAPKVMSVQLHGGAAECTDRKNVGLVKSKSQRTISVPAGNNVFTVGVDTGRPSVLGALGAVGGIIVAMTYKGCTPTIDFVPEANRSYTFRMTSDGNDCTYQFTTQNSEGKAEPVPFTPREWIRAATEAGPFCKKK